MNSHHQPLSQVPPNAPLHNGHNGRPVHMPYAPSPPYHHPSPYQAYPYPYPVPYARAPQQWSPYHVQMQMPRAYPAYPQMTPYPMHHNYPQMRPPPQTAPSPSVHSPAIVSPPPSNQQFSAPSPAPPPAVPPPNNDTAPSTPPPLPSTPIVRAASPQRTPFYPPLPWQSFEGDFPTKRGRRRRRPAPQSADVPVQLPTRTGISESFRTPQPDDATKQPAEDNPAILPSHSESSLVSQAPSEPLSAQSTTPSSVTQPNTNKSDVPSRLVVGIVPIVPAVPNLAGIARPPKQGSQSFAQESVQAPSPSNAELLEKSVETAKQSDETQAKNDEAATRTVPKSWADLVRSKASAAAISTTSQESTQNNSSNGYGAKSSSLAEALNSFSVKQSKESHKIAFLEPRGLVNTGNMCYMNSILQVLVFCIPFYNFLESIGRRAAHSFKSDTPMMDAMIMFVREYKVIDAASSVEQLRLRLKDTELEQYGEPFIPEFVYDIIRRLPRFSSMRRGHQQDAEEFLGFLLEELHEECSKAIKSALNKDGSGTSTPTNGIMSPLSESTDSLVTEDSGWLEVGPKQRAAITRSSGITATESPINKIFGGKLRSELRVPGMKGSVTLEPYQPLQLDIGAPNVTNIVEALKGLTRSETLHGDFNSPRGPGSTATKQVTIETLPQVLILHLKRFQYDNAGGTQKIWKKVGYPLELEIPKEVFPQHKRGGLLAHAGLPKYRLISVVYHHGKNASGGHYTVDVRRQEGREWIRLDDTVIKRIRSEDVAEGGSEEDPKVLAAALEKHKANQAPGKSGNVYDQIAADDDDDDQARADKPWSQVNGPVAPPTSNKKWSNVANGVATPSKSAGDRTPVGRSSVKDNKVAYILFYQKLDS